MAIRISAIEQKLLYLGKLNPIAELYPDNKVKSLFIYADKGNVPSAMESYDENGDLTGKFRVVSNHLGSVTMVVNAETREAVQEIEYDVWGNVLNDTNPNFQPFYFAGGIYDADTGLTRFGARDYAGQEAQVSRSIGNTRATDPQTGRWTATLKYKFLYDFKKSQKLKDPIGFAGGLTSLYDYVGGDPVNFVDPSGSRGSILPRPPSAVYGQNPGQRPMPRPPHGSQQAPIPRPPHMQKPIRNPNSNGTGQHENPSSGLYDALEGPTGHEGSGFLDHFNKSEPVKSGWKRANGMPSDALDSLGVPRRFDYYDDGNACFSGK